MRRIALLATVVFAVACAKTQGPTARPAGAPSVIPANASLYGIVDLLALAQSSVLKEQLLARYRDRALKRVGLRPEDALKATAPAQFFGLSTDALAAFVPGLFVEGAVARKHRGVELVARGEQVAARVEGGSIVGDPAAVAAALDVLKGGAPALANSSLQALIKEGSVYKTMRIATRQPSQVFSILPIGPPSNIMARMKEVAAYLTLEGTILWAKIVVTGKDSGAGRAVADWAEQKRKGLRGMLDGFKETAGIFGSALEPAIAAVDAIKVSAGDNRAVAVLNTDLEPIFSSGLLTVLRTLQLLGQ